MDNENTYQKFMDLLGKMPENLNIIDEEIDIKIQMDYFDASKKNKELKIDESEILKNQFEIFENNYNIEQKKDLLIQLASLDNVEAYRVIEKYEKIADQQLKAWASLALQESRMLLESSLLNEKQIIISTGLGGKNNKLRYFAALNSSKNQPFTELQKKLIKKEFEFVLKNQSGKIEDIQFEKGFATIVVLVPLKTSVKIVVESVISECNQIGNFVNTKFILTNTKKYSIDEIKKWWTNIL